MDSGMISKIQKSKQYAQEPERISFTAFRVIFQGENAMHLVVYNQGAWSCECRFFQQRGLCSHTMAMERLLGPMLPSESVEKAAPASAK